MKDYESWGKYPKVKHEAVKQIYWRNMPLALDQYDKPVLPYGLGRSYGDSCLNEGGILLDTSALSHFIAFDKQKGLLRCEAGVSLDECLKLIVPAGWFLPVTPGTKYVSVAGAIANDVHGKNHHQGGTFGCHLTQFELLRSDGQRLLCSPTENVEFFRATIGGLGLTGLILWAEFRLKAIKSAYIDSERIKFSNLDEFFAISERSHQDYEYIVAWVDCLAKGENLGRGWLVRGNHAEGDYPLKLHQSFPLAVPFELPKFVLNRLTMKAFNFFVYNLYQMPKKVRKVIHYEPFFYPLDMIGNWNRIYGKRGFMQYQFVLPDDPDHRIIRQIITRIAEFGQGFLNVFKEFGSMPSPGMLSFPRQGVTLALDFPNNGAPTLRLLEELDELVRQANGVLYPAKDGRMSAADFQRFYPQWEAFSHYVDPHFSSSFWRRVTESNGQL
jgi:FAD/FMN-containing dehydrogenase